MGENTLTTRAGLGWDRAANTYYAYINRLSIRDIELPSSLKPFASISRNNKMIVPGPECDCDPLPRG